MFLNELIHITTITKQNLLSYIWVKKKKKNPDQESDKRTNSKYYTFWDFTSLHFFNKCFCDHPLSPHLPCLPEIQETLSHSVSLVSLWRHQTSVWPTPVMLTTLYPILSSLSKTSLGGSSTWYSELWDTQMSQVV